MKAFLAAETKKLAAEISLQQGFAPSQRHPSTGYETAYLEHFGKQFLRSHLITGRTTGIPSVRIMAIQTTERTTLQEGHKTNSGTVDGPETLQ